MTDRVWIRFSESGNNIRKWQSEPFEGGTEYVLASESSDYLLSIIADIRMKCGVGAKPMLSELADVIAAKIEASPQPANPAQVPGSLPLEQRLRQYEGRQWETTACYNGLRDEAADELSKRYLARIAAEAELAEVWQNYIDANEARLDGIRVLEKVADARMPGEARRLAVEHLRAALSRSEPQAAPVSHGGAE